MILQKLYADLLLKKHLLLLSMFKTVALLYFCFYVFVEFSYIFVRIL